MSRRLDIREGFVPEFEVVEQVAERFRCMSKDTKRGERGWR